MRIFMLILTNFLRTFILKIYKKNLFCLPTVNIYAIDALIPNSLNEGIIPTIETIHSLVSAPLGLKLLTRYLLDPVIHQNQYRSYSANQIKLVPLPTVLQELLLVPDLTVLMVEFDPQVLAKKVQDLS